MIYDHIDQILLEAFTKWRELNDNKKWFSVGQIFLANLMKWTSKVCFITALGATGAGSLGMAASESMIEVQSYVWSDGRVTYQRSDTCANIACLISFSIFMFGVACFIAAVLLLLLAYLFWILSFIYLFKTDIEFELLYAEKLEHLNNQVIAIENEKPKANDEGYLKLWKESNQKRIAELKHRIRALENLRELERIKRSKGKIVPDVADDPKFDDFLREYQIGLNEYSIRAGEFAVNSYLNDVLQADQEQAKAIAEEQKISFEEAREVQKQAALATFKEDLDMVKGEASKNARLEGRSVLHKIFKTEACTEDEVAILKAIENLNSKV